MLRHDVKLERHKLARMESSLFRKLYRSKLSDGVVASFRSSHHGNDQRQSQDMPLFQTDCDPLMQVLPMFEVSRVPEMCPKKFSALTVLGLFQFAFLLVTCHHASL